MKRQLFLLFLIACVFAGLAAKFLLRPNPHRNALLARELATRGLGEYIARTQPGQRVLIVSNPFTQRRGIAREILETEEAGIRGLREGFGKGVKVSTIAYPALKQQAMENPRALITNPETTTPLSYLIAPGTFDDLAKEHTDCRIIVSLIGLPANLADCQVWHAVDAPGFALLFPDLRIIGGTASIQSAVKSRRLLAFVLRKPGGVEDQQRLGKDLRAEFDRRFLLVTSENIEQVLQTYPALF